MLAAEYCTAENGRFRILVNTRSSLVAVGQPIAADPRPEPRALRPKILITPWWVVKTYPGQDGVRCRA